MSWGEYDQMFFSIEMKRKYYFEGGRGAFYF
jgi:hypothetical protein